MGAVRGPARCGAGEILEWTWLGETATSPRERGRERLRVARPALEVATAAVSEPDGFTHTRLWESAERNLAPIYTSAD